MYVASVNYVLSGYLFPIWVLTVPVSFLLCLSVPDVMPINIIIIIIITHRYSFLEFLFGFS